MPCLSRKAFHLWVMIISFTYNFRSSSTRIPLAVLATVNNQRCILIKELKAEWCPQFKGSAHFTPVFLNSIDFSGTVICFAAAVRSLDGSLANSFLTRETWIFYLILTITKNFWFVRVFTSPVNRSLGLPHARTRIKSQQAWRENLTA